jgi:hypothetical protein
MQQSKKGAEKYCSKAKQMKIIFILKKVPGNVQA